MEQECLLSLENMNSSLKKSKEKIQKKPTTTKKQTRTQRLKVLSESIVCLLFRKIGRRSPPSRRENCVRRTIPSMK